MLRKIIDIIKYKYDEYKVTHKIHVALCSLALENNRIKVLYKFKKKYTSIPLYFFIEDVYSQELELIFSYNDKIIIFEVLGVYKYLNKYSNIKQIIPFLDDINDQLSSKI